MNEEIRNKVILDQDFMNRNLMNAIFKDVWFVNVSFMNSELMNAQFLGCTFEKVNLMNANLMNAQFIDCQMVRVNLKNAKLRNTIFKNLVHDKSTKLPREMWDDPDYWPSGSK